MDELDLPKASLQKIIKNELPGMATQKDARVALTKASTVFISYITAIATEMNKKVSHEEIMKALVEADFNEIAQEVKETYKKYSDSKKAGSNKRKRSEKEGQS
ncbi:hypothetical protein MP638_000483 [Amoeboaphelidium occidentale]|nr:hypothetical protein MP638_000483 [Amoeboaphelidium occidentale]